MSGTRRKPGRMGGHIEPFRERLLAAGYTPGTVRGSLMVMGQLGRWMQANLADDAQLIDEHIEMFVGSLQSRTAQHVPRLRSTDPLVAYLRDAGVLESVRLEPLTPVDKVLVEFRSWMIAERGLAAGTVLRYENTARRFLNERHAVAGDRLPLPHEVGEAISRYLVAARPVSVSRRVFLTAKAPIEPMLPARVNDITRRACVRVGIGRVGAHRLRHTLASELLGKGSTIIEVSQVLRHRDLATTAIYAKVDLDTLRQVAQPWPGAQR